MSALSMVNPAWAAPPGTWIHPIDGWGYVEAIDGKLADQFEARIEMSGTDIGDGVLGWRGTVSTPGHKYAGLRLTMSPRHTTWTRIVVVHVEDHEKLVFSGMAETSGLECEWL
ncbi:MAG: hypothetical protein ACT4N8_02880 [Sphingosinicella sp.]|uniref:hypothetical protein n=1 Tax=Sphingosinicella sp. TaxID=1917971 RepID=UPI004037BC8D